MSASAGSVLCSQAKPGVKLVNNVPSNIPIVLGDTGRIIQIFYNLIGNACKFTHSGTISITACHELDVVVSVCDTGIGIPEEKFDQIFSPFEQVDMGITRRYGGTGLGLSLVKQLVEAHEGHITVRSKLGVGTTFTFTLKVRHQLRMPLHSITTNDCFWVHSDSANIVLQRSCCKDSVHIDVASPPCDGLHCNAGVGQNSCSA